VYYLETAVSLALPFLHGANTPQYAVVKDWISVFSKRVDSVEDVNALNMGMPLEAFILILNFFIRESR
jgi:hypothetical protein